MNKKLLEFAGFTCSNSIWCYPDGIVIENGLPNFTKSLDDVFKWLVPKLYEQDYYYDLMQWNNGQHKAIINKKTIEWAVTASDAIEETPALALCNAIIKLIEEEKT